jgi:D-3-phosphoglycerate dehydrogenase
MKKVLITDYAWKSLDPEREILGKAGATLVVAETGSEEELEHLAPTADGILTCWKNVTEPVIRKAERCLAIGRYGIGLDNIAVPCATTLGIVVTNVPAYCLEEVSDHAMALLLSCARKVTASDRAIRSGVYNLQAQTPLYRLRGRILGILGLGKIGRTLARKALAFGFKVIAYDLLFQPSPELAEVESVSFEDLLRRSDYISIHIPFTPASRHLFSRDAFRMMKRSAILINTARGDVVDEDGLLWALESGEIAGAALDVLSKEPPDPAYALLRHPNVVVTPHAAFNSVESLLELQETAATQMASVLSGALPEFVVNPEVLKQPNLRAAFRR